MGVYDHLRCEYPLPVEGANDLEFQTKDTPEKYLGYYKIDSEGRLWHEDYDIEDKSDAAKWRKEHPGEEEPEWHLADFGGMCSRVNKRWVEEHFTGEICFYSNKRDDYGKSKGWVEFSAYFVKGKLNQLHLIENTDK